MENSATQFNELKFIQSVRCGDIVAFESLLYAYEKRIFNYIFRMVQHQEDTEDLVQETFIKVFRKIHTFDQSKDEAKAARDAFNAAKKAALTIFNAAKKAASSTSAASTGTTGTVTPTTGVNVQ